MHKFNRGSYIFLEMLFFDIAGLLAAFVASFAICRAFTFLHPIETYTWLLVVYVPMFILAMWISDMYHRLTFNYYDRLVKNVFRSSLLSAVSIAALLFYTRELYFSRWYFSLFFLLSFLITVLHRIFFYKWKQKGNRFFPARKVVIVGVRNVVDRYHYFLGKTNVAVETVGYVGMDGRSDPSLHPNLGGIESLNEILKRQIVDEVVFAIEAKHLGEIEPYVLLCEEMGITSRLILNVYDKSASKVHFTALGTLPMLTLHTVNLNDMQLFMKRVVDIVGALIGLTITGLLSLFIVPAIKISSPGPAIFAQHRVGTNGRTFKIYKFRSMYADAEARKKELAAANKINGGFMFKMDNDPRITPIGRFLRKTSLDELPQFLNVLKGDMSLVGTRPPTIDEVNKYQTHHYRRISIKPGLTGMWQIKGRSEVTNFEQVVRLDTEYIDQWSVWLDIKIILKTVLVVLKSRGAY